MGRGECVVGVGIGERGVRGAEPPDFSRGDRQGRRGGVAHRVGEEAQGGPGADTVSVHRPAAVPRGGERERSRRRADGVWCDVVAAAARGALGENWKLLARTG